MLLSLTFLKKHHYLIYHEKNLDNPTPHITIPSNSRFIHLHSTDHINKLHSVSTATNHEKKLKNFTEKTLY